jgi:hypothetical protein
VVKKKRNGVCPKGYKDSRNKQYTRPCYRCQNKKERKATNRANKRIDKDFNEATKNMFPDIGWTEEQQAKEDAAARQEMIAKGLGDWLI